MFWRSAAFAVAWAVGHASKRRPATKSAMMTHHVRILLITRPILPLGKKFKLFLKAPRRAS
ncbi:hypothetical protein BJF93_17275 [Xaviernesmea oryzae]|uniref:Uncharacterized protein n=1 Tax=Xaviernesmea oryzae TaxID=464029 RepID=A0A1Q9AT47_9HYPH|nr:hypothetical protein BJF93_17275 [Xaviernesmea oryzae]